uniref:S41 family peptidase n=1 Tax=uncultured Draconibacterium sp. TaxID=1573823 RepID=UPI003217FEA5
MRSILLLLLFTIISGNTLFAQTVLSDTEKLATASRVWGFLKYYHPEVARGNMDWDAQLINILPEIESAATKEELSAVYLTWIKSLGEVKKCRSCREKPESGYFTKNFDLGWTQNSKLFTPELSQQLKFIEENRNQKKNHYVTADRISDYAVITNEKKYTNFEYPDRNYRLLALFNYWNVIEYFFPYKYQTNQNWNDVLTEMIPKFKNAENAGEYHLAMLELVTKIDDSHALFNSNVLKKQLGSKSIPTRQNMIGNKLIVTGFWNDSLAAINNLQPGDEIVRINNQSVNEIVQQNLKYSIGSTQKRKTNNAIMRALLCNNDSMLLVTKRNGKIIDRKVKLYTFKEMNSGKTREFHKYKILENNIGYINMPLLNAKDAEEIMQKVKHCNALIINVRNYPKFIFRRISRHLNPAKKEFVKIIKPDLTYPGKFIWKEEKTTGIKNDDYFKGKVILLVDGNTQSRAEYTVMSFQTAPNVTTIGNQTAGADGNVSLFEFAGGYRTSMSGLGIFYPDGTETQRKGVKIDIEVQPTQQGIIEGRDEILEKAIEFAKLRI